MINNKLIYSMSWANIRIPRKRDVSKIPEELRPSIIPRVQRPEVIHSELFQKKIEKERSEKAERGKLEVNPRQYVSTKIDSSLKPTAYELAFNDNSYVFVILRNIRTIRDNDLWISCYNSIRKFYTNKIVIIDDNSTINTVNGKLTNTEVITSEFNGAGEVLPYYYFLKHKWADRMIFLHDSMCMNRIFNDKELTGTKFHWHFKQNVEDKKVTKYISLFKNKELNNEITEFMQLNKWKGCFGAGSIIDLTIIEYLEEQHGMFTNLVLHIKTRKDRESFERILGIVLYYEGIMDENCSNFGDILAYPGAFELDNIDAALYTLGQKGYNTAIVKIWKGR